MNSEPIDATRARGSAVETFDLGAILTATTGTMLSLKGFGEFQRLIQHLAGGPVWTHQLPAATDALAPALIGMHPWLADITVPADLAEASLRVWLAELEAKHGVEHAVTTVEGGWSSDPVADLVERLVPGSAVQVVVSDGEPE